MRISRPLLILALAFLTSGCATGGATYWPPGTKAVVVTPNSHRLLVRVPADQKEIAGGRNWVPIESGTRVECLDDSGYKQVNPGQSDPSPTADVRVQLLEGNDNRLEVFIPREALAGAVEPTSPSLAAAPWLFVVVILSLVVMHLMTTGVEALKRRREFVRHWIATHPGERLPERTRTHQAVYAMSPAGINDQTEWTAWLASRNARSRSRQVERSRESEIVFRDGSSKNDS